jgi:hypothetical protein
MKIFTEIKMQWDDGMGRYVRLYDKTYEYNGLVALACGASNSQKQIEQSQQNFMKQAQTQAGQVFGASNQVFNSLMSTFAPTIAAGPNQQGFSPALLSAMNSQAISNVGQSYKNAKAAVGNQQAALGGGNTALPSGAEIGVNLGLAEAGANQTASTLNQITQENYAVGRQNYDKAVAGLEQAPGVFSTSTGATNAATGAGEAAANTANQIAQQDNSWVSAVTGAIGSVAGAALGPGGAITKGLGGKQGASNTGSN